MANLLKTLSLAATMALSTVPMARSEGFAGAFLAAKSANIANDYVDAAYYYTQAMIAEPENGYIMQGGLFAYVAAGDVLAAEAIARKMAAADFKDEYAHTVMIAGAFERGDYSAALGLMADSSFEMNPLIKQLLSGWALVGMEEVDAGLETLATPSENDAITAFGLYNKGLVLAYLGRMQEADAIFSAGGAYVNRGAVLAHAQIMATLGQHEGALEIMVNGAGAGFSDRESADLRVQLAAEETIAFDRIATPQEGASETLLVIADALRSDDSQRLALLYARLASALQPDNAVALLLIGDILTEQSQFALALKAYDAVPEGNPWVLNAKTGRALNLRQNDDLDGAITTLRAALEIKPDSITLWQSLGDVLRQNGDLTPAREAYTNAIDLLPAPDIPAAWQLFYARAVVEHRADNWPAAEADFRQALALNPAQPDALNYLGYSLVDRGEKLDEALGMIEAAVEAKPDSGAIADSLGWVYYRLGRFEDAETAMEIAVKLLPVDPILSDHFGDVLWMVDRKREARFQWRRALSYGPEEADAEQIRDKLSRGLDAVLADE
ncbi:MAG TPA: tetratricopeptide repeat protein [Rhodobacteraceae bacterium]|nr:tetratricopeptide repeat protein [Paracoccaceae bacterium]